MDVTNTNYFSCKMNLCHQNITIHMVMKCIFIDMSPFQVFPLSQPIRITHKYKGSNFSQTINQVLIMISFVYIIMNQLSQKFKFLTLPHPQAFFICSVDKAYGHSTLNLTLFFKNRGGKYQAS
jgi:hypothetical protein